MTINLENREKFNKEDEKILDSQTKEVIENIYDSFDDLQKSASESGGFLYLDQKDIWIDPRARTLVIREPEKKKGLEAFNKRDEFEKAWPVGEDINQWAEKENAIFDGVISPPADHPEIGGRICLSVVHVYKTKDETFVSVPILPAVEQSLQKPQRYAGNAKLTAEIVRGNRFPSAKELLQVAAKKETHSLVEIQKENPEEKILGQPVIRETGLWNVRFVRNVKGRESYSEIKNCHIQRDPETGTLDLFLMQEEFVFENFDDFQPQLNLPSDLKRVNTLVSLDKLKKTKEGEAPEIERLFFDNKEIKNIEKLPGNYRDLFGQNEEGIFFFKNLKQVPPLRAFLKLEKRIVGETSKDVANQIQEKIGELFEDLMEKVLKTPKIPNNSEDYKAALPGKRELKDIIENQPREFQDWALKLGGREIISRPDFVLEDGTFVEVKAGGKLGLKPKKREQLFRMVLYKLLKGEDFKIRVITLGEEAATSDPVFSQIKYENVFNTEWGAKITERDMKPIRMWQKNLPK